MDIGRRKCILRDETESVLEENSVLLDVYKTYSRRSCLMECRARELQSQCGCLPYYFPNFAQFWKTSTTCNLTGLDCLASQISESEFTY